MELQRIPSVELQIIVGASGVLDKFGRVVDVVEADGFEVLRSIYYVVEGENLITQAKSTGLGIVELSTAFADFSPDAVLTVADRFETMATAIAASYMNIPLVHLQGGEVSGNIDDRVRNAITMLSDYHFVATEESARRVISMGAEESQVYNFGCPSIDIIANSNLDDVQDLPLYQGAGVPIDWSSPFLLMIQHPVTTSYGHSYDQVMETIEALRQFRDYQKVILWPNPDAGSDDVSKAIRHVRETNPIENSFFIKNFSPVDYVKVLNLCACAIGNSSSFIREGAFLGTPAVIVGDRQRGREHGPNVTFTSYSKDRIAKAISLQVSRGKYPSDPRFGNGSAGTRIARQLVSLLSVRQFSKQSPETLQKYLKTI